MTEKEVAPVKKEEDNNEDNDIGDSELESAIIRQVEYYFSDVNLPRDKFLREQVKLDDGWVPLDILTRFNRLAKLSTDTDVIANALTNSTSGVVEVSDDNKKIRRNPELPIPEMNEERRKELLARTVYAKGINKDASLDDLIKFFKQYDKVENIVMRRYIDKKTKVKQFKGSVFVTFKTKEQAEKFMKTEDLKYDGNTLLVLWQENYLQQKQEEYVAKKEQRDKKTKNKGDDKPEKEEFTLPTGTVFHFSEGGDKMKREDVKEALVALGADVAYIDFKVGDSEGWARLAKENAAIELADKITDGKLKIGEAEVVFKLLEGSEEKTYLDKTVGEMIEQVKLDDGRVPLDILTRFNRLAKLSTDTDVIANALTNSTSGVVEVSDDNKKIRRNPELPLPEMNEERRKELLARTVYAKGFNKDASLNDLIKFFKQYDKVENIVMRRYIDKKTKVKQFKGSVIVTFKTKEQAEKYMKTEDLKYDGNTLLVLWQENYLQQKQEEYVAKKEQRDKKTKNKGDDKPEKEEFTLPTGTVFHFSEGGDKMKREDVKEALVALGADVAYIDFKVGDSEGWARLAKENAAIELADKITDGKLKIGEAEVVFKLLEGSEEKTYLDKTVGEMVRRRKNQKNHGKQHKGFKNKGRQGRKRKQERHDDAPPSKIKAES